MVALLVNLQNHSARKEIVSLAIFQVNGTVNACVCMCVCVHVCVCVHAFVCVCVYVCWFLLAIYFE